MCTVGLTSAWKINSMLNYRKFKPLNLFKLSCTATEHFKQFKAVLRWAFLVPPDQNFFSVLGDLIFSCCNVFSIIWPDSEIWVITMPIVLLLYTNIAHD